MDIKFDPILRDLDLGPDGDFIIIENVSTQNGGIILEGRCINLIQPQVGIGFNSQVQGSHLAEAALQLNRWVSQILVDGGRASWQSLPATLNGFSFNANVNYEL